MKDILHLTPERVMFLGALTAFAWNLKILWGAVIDRILTKKIWIFISLSGSLAIALYLGLLLPEKRFNLNLLIIILSIASLFTCLRDIALDGASCIFGKENNNLSRIQSIQWGSIIISSIIVGVCGGWIAQNSNYRVGFLSLIPFYILLGIVALLYREGRQNIDNKKPTLISYASLFKNKNFILVCLFVLLYNFNPSFGTVLGYKIRDEFKWSEQFIGNLSAISSLCSLVGVFLFYKIGDKINLKNWLYWSVFVGAITTLGYLWFVPVSAIAYDITFSMIGTFIRLLMLTFIAKQVIVGLESTSFATLCGIVNLAGTLSLLAGSKLLPMLGYNNLVLLSAITSFACLPLLKRLND